MSGLACVFARDGAAVGGADVDAVLQGQVHRGPDGLALWCEGSIGLGHAVLGANGGRRAVEPLVDDGGRLAIVGDLRIDNRRDLIADLDPLPKGISDAGIVLQAYRRWGADAPEHLVGSFAFVIWDAHRRRVFCARDHLGVKPLTYFLSEKLFVCASEPEAVACARGVPRRINEARIADFLVSELEGVNHTSTFFEGVVRLPPAHVLVIGPDGHRLRRYWEPEFGTELRLGSDEEYAEVFSSVFREAVRSCLHDLAAPGLLLSGGLDSGAILATSSALAASGEVSPITTYSFSDPKWDRSPETGCMRELIKAHGLESVVTTPEDITAMPVDRRRGFFDCGEPFDSIMVVAGLGYFLAARRGTRVVLDGIDGDVVASASAPLDFLIRRGRAFRAWREAAGYRRRWGMGTPPLRAVVGGAARAWLPRPITVSLRRFRDGVVSSDDTLRDSLIDASFARRVELGDRLAQARRHGDSGGNVDPAAIHAASLIHPWVAASLERYDRVAAARGIEARHPFYDLRLVELCLSLPWDLKTRNGWTKFGLRLAASETVPDSVRWRHDFGDVLWRSNAAILAAERSHIIGLLESHRGLLAEFVDRAKLDVLCSSRERNVADREGVWLWEAVTLARWLARIG